MAVKQKKPKKVRVEMTLWDVILSYPDLANPKPYKGKIYYKVDALMEEDHPQLGDLRAALKKVKVATFGPDKSEWPEKGNPTIQDGDAREDSKGYKGRKYISTSTQQPVPVVGPSGKEFNPAMVKGGMFGNVAICISAWENDGEVGVSIYLQGVQIDTKKKSLNFGGGKTVQKMFELESEDDDDGDDSTEADNPDSDGDDDDEPRSKKKKASHDEEDSDDDQDEAQESDDDEDSPPVKKKKGKKNFDEDE